MITFVMPIFITAAVASTLLGLLYKTIARAYIKNALKDTDFKAIAASKPVQEAINAHIENINLEDKIQGALNKRLDTLLDVFKNEIPMASMVLTPVLTEKLNKLASKELIKIIPEIKASIAGQALLIDDALCNKLKTINPDLLIEAFFPSTATVCGLVFAGIALLGTLQQLLQRFYAS